MNQALRAQHPVRRPALRAFAISALAALVLFLPFLVVDKGFFLYCGDFNSQQIPFYQYCQQFIQSGGGSFSWATDLGSGFLNTYSFYTLGSPFFWLSCLLPNHWLPYAMAPLLCLKFGVGGLGAYLYLRRYTKTINGALIGSALFTLSGWGIYNIFFNHFIDCMVLFPFLLAALDCYIYDKQRAVLPLAIAVNLLCNYFFFVGEALFVALYFFIKLGAKDYRLSLREFFQLAFEVVVGCLLGCLLIFPAAASLLENPRTDNFANGYGMLFYGKVHQYFAILRSLLVPPDPPYLPGVFSQATVKWTSMSGYLPLVSMAGVLAWCRARRGSPHKRILAVSLVMALVPILNSAFYAFNSSYYARWYYMPVLLMALATVNALEDEDVDLVGGIRLTAILIALFAVFGLVPAKEEESWTIGVADNAALFWLTLLLGLLGLLIFYCIVSWTRGEKRFARTMLAGVLAFGVFTGIVHISVGKFPQWEGDSDYKRETYDVIDAIELPRDHFYRIDTYECYENLGLFLDLPCIRCFNSTVSPSILKFYPTVGVKRDVSSKPETNLFALRGLLSVEYLLMPVDAQANYEAEETTTGFVFDYLTGDGVYAVWRNENAVPMGFTYDYYVLPETAEKVSTSYRSNLYLRAIELSEEQVARYGENLEPLPEDQLYISSYTRYVEDCDDRRANACDSFVATRSGFTATINLDKENLVFFSVPYDEGFSATVNGEEAEVLEVDGGLIAIPAGAGDNEIVLTLTPKWLPLSCGLTLLGALLFAGYLAVVLYDRRKNGPPTGRFVPLEVAADHPGAGWTLPEPEPKNEDESQED
ncbi:MAG TPA: YfhO family protein [Candidatus Pygmaiobacter gallistercoris]|nr:YfhO family protein [Candidatus Pygmaiobacter gallistercoris]